ncbi:MAG: EAL domain-containing protein [Betaproteobacteria bacterium]
MTELPNIARLFLALFLLSIWLTRRSNRTPLYWAIAYLALAAGSLSYQFGADGRYSSLLYLAPLFPGIYVGTFWAGTQHFRERPVRWQSISLLTLATSAMILLVLATSVEQSSIAVGVAVGLVNTWAGWVIWTRNRNYRIVAGIVFAQALMLLCAYSLVWQGPSVFLGMAAGYGVLAIGLVYVILRESNESISRQATSDELTSLPNRHLLLDRLETALRASSLTGLTCAVLVVDIDNLRRINEAFGHSAGDQLLRDIATRLLRIAGPQHTLARYGGDEFVLLVSRPTAADAIRLAEEISNDIIETISQPFPVAGVKTALTVSIGIAVSGEDGDTPDLLVQRAKLATAQAPQTDRNTWRFFNREMNERAQREIVIERHMWRALQNGEFSIVYQPIVAANGRGIAKAEALLRWTNPELGVISPDEFIRIAEHSGLVIEVGDWVLGQACAQAAACAASHSPAPVMCVNVSALQLRRPGFAASVAAVLARHALPAARLELEFTENVMIDDDEIVLAQIRQLRELGVSLSLDDFGTGFSSLSYLTRFEFSTLKIDRTFVRALENDDRSRRLAESICAIGKSLGLALVAEGVESEYQAAAMTRFGVNYMQGFLFSKPLSADEFVTWLAAERANG